MTIENSRHGPSASGIGVRKADHEDDFPHLHRNMQAIHSELDALLVDLPAPQLPILEEVVATAPLPSQRHAPAFAAMLKGRIAQVKAANGYDEVVKVNAAIDAHRKAAGREAHNAVERAKYASRIRQEEGRLVNPYGVPDTLEKRELARSKKAAQNKTKTAEEIESERLRNTEGRARLRRAELAGLEPAEREIKRAEESKKRAVRRKAKVDREATEAQLEEQAHYAQIPGFARF